MVLIKLPEKWDSIGDRSFPLESLLFISFVHSVCIHLHSLKTGDIGIDGIPCRSYPIAPFSSRCPISTHVPHREYYVRMWAMFQDSGCFIIVARPGG